MKMYKKVMAAALAGVMTVSMSATAFAADDDGYILKATNEDSKSSDNDLVIAIEGSVSSMDPANIPDTNAISATRGVYETLVSFDENQELTGKLAESWEVSDDSLTLLSIFVRVLNSRTEQTSMQQQLKQTMIV